MENYVLGTKVITLISILVHDTETRSQAYADFFGIEKPQWIMTDTVDKAQTQYRGKRSEARAKLAFFDVGSLEIELIEPDQNPSIWRELLNKNGEGPHYIAFEIEGMKDKIAVLERSQMPLLQKGEYTGGRAETFQARFRRGYRTRLLAGRPAQGPARFAVK
jgi:methylmalonyl-CoA/ethylmalonyl-CoA epimerase